MDNFNVYHELMDSINSKLKSLGAQKTECTLKISDIKEITAEACMFNLMRTYTSEQLTLRAIKDNKAGSISISSIDDDSVAKAIQKCMDAIEYVDADENNDISPLIENKDFKRGVLNANVEKMAERLVQLSEDIKSDYPFIMFELGGKYTHNYEIYTNSNGVKFTDENGSYYIEASFTAVKDGQTTSFGPGVYFQVLDPDIRYIDCNNMRKEIEKAMSLLNPVGVGEKFVGKLIATPIFTRSVFSYLSRISLIDNKISGKTSRLINSLGKKIADERISFSYKPYSDDVLIGKRFTGDGYLEKNLDIIEKGILKSFRLTAQTARESGLQNSMNSGSSMHIKPGEKSIDDIISGIDKGVIIGRYSGNEPTEEGEISGVVKNGFLIENGKIKAPLKETMLSGNIFDMINNVADISKDCLKDGSSVLPWIVFNNITIN